MKTDTVYTVYMAKELRHYTAVAGLLTAVVAEGLHALLCDPFPLPCHLNERHDVIHWPSILFFFTWFSFLWRQVFVSTKTIQRNSCFCNNEHALSALHFVCTVKDCKKKNALNLKGWEEEEHCRCWML